MKIKSIVIVLVLLVLAVAMITPVAAQNTVTVDQTTNGYQDHYWDGSVDHHSWRWENGVLVYNDVYAQDDYGYEWMTVDTIYNNTYTADYGGGTGSSSVIVESETWAESDTTETIDTYNSPAVGVVEGSHTVIDTHDDWWGTYEEETNTSWTP